MTETAQVLAIDVCKKLKQVSDPERKEWARNYYPTQMQVLGVKVPDLRPISNEFYKRLRKSTSEEVLDFALILVDSGVLECRQVGYEVLARHKGAMASLTTGDLEVLGRGIDNWVSTDVFAGLVAGPVWREGQVPDEVIRNWALSKDRWWRRAAVVSTVALNQKARGGEGDTPRTLDICRLVASDQDEMVAKALSWALRELAKRDTTPVIEFLDEYDAILPSRVKREVKRKIETGRKY
jgi:3-methyladenine DNA glycosylase AlkD